MFTYTGTSTVQMAKQYRAAESAGQRKTWTRKLRSPRLAPPSVLSSRWWVAAEGLRYGRTTGGTGTPRAAW